MKIFSPKDFYQAGARSYIAIRSDEAWLELAKFQMYQGAAEGAPAAASLMGYSGSATGGDMVCNFFLNLGYFISVDYTLPHVEDPGGGYFTTNISPSAP